jgi:hypothetical protein
LAFRIAIAADPFYEKHPKLRSRDRVGRTRGREFAGSDGHAHLRFVAALGQTYSIQASTDLMNWIRLDTRSPEANGVTDFEDVEANHNAARFYRVEGM